MAQVSKHKTVILAGRESAYGTQQTIPTEKHACMFEYDYGVQASDVGVKTQTLMPMAMERTIGREMPTCKLSGALTDSYEWLLEAYFNNIGTPYAHQTVDARYSYTIYQSIPASESDAGDGIMVLGARLETLNITRNGDVMNFEASFRAKSIADGVDFSALDLTTVVDTTAPEVTPFLWQNVTASMLDAAYTNINDFGLTLTNTYADDDIIYQNSATKIQDIVCSSTGELTYQVIYDTVNDVAAAAEIENDLITDSISLVNDNATWNIVTYGRLANPSRPDAEKCIYVTDNTVTLLGDSTHDAITITIA